MQRCSKCQAEVQGSPKFCAECGKSFVPNPVPVAAGEDGLFYCFKHKREATRVSCGRCDRPICTRCMVMSPAGVRCKDCARNKVPVRMRGVLHDAGAGFANTSTCQKAWYVMFAMMFVNFFLGMFGGRRD